MGRNATRTIVLWVLLIILFLALWEFLQKTPGPHPAEATHESGTSPWAVTAVIVVIGALFVGYAKLVNRVRRANQKGIELLSEGKRAEALEVLEKAASMIAGGWAPKFNAALCLLELGRPDEALPRFEKVARSSALEKVPLQGAAVMHFAALSASLAGDESRAREWFEKGGKLANSPMSAVVEATLLARAGNAGAAVHVVETRWRELESCSAVYRKAARAIQAWSAAQIGQPEPYILEAIGGAKPCAPGELDFLGVRWPELAAFLKARGMSGA